MQVKQGLENLTAAGALGYHEKPTDKLQGGLNFTMGKGDRRSKKSKIWRHSYGNSRPRPQKKKRAKASGKSG
jgi:ribosomal small subunit protein bTHX